MHITIECQESEQLNFKLSNHYIEKRSKEDIENKLIELERSLNDYLHFKMNLLGFYAIRNANLLKLNAKVEE